MQIKRHDSVWWNSETVPHGASGPAIYPRPCSGGGRRGSTAPASTTKKLFPCADRSLGGGKLFPGGQVKGEVRHHGAPFGGVFACLREGSSVFLVAELANEGVEGGREQKAEAGHTQHSEQHRCAQRLPHLRACSGRNGERGNAQNE